MASQLIREFTYLYGAVCPEAGACFFLIMPASDTECFQIFLDHLGKRYSRQDILLFVDGAGNHLSSELAAPGNITLRFLPPYSPELNPPLKSMDEVYEKLEEATMYIERNPTLVRSITSFPYIAKSF